jgi:molybdopterin converting factor small subunit
MKVKALFHGILADWVGAREASFEMPEGATYRDLVAEIGRRYRKNMPQQLWDEEANCLSREIMAVGAKGRIESVDTPLREGEEIKFLLMLAGG